jgi:hypothetical protein
VLLCAQMRSASLALALLPRAARSARKYLVPFVLLHPLCVKGVDCFIFLLRHLAHYPCRLHHHIRLPLIARRAGKASPGGVNAECKDCPVDFFSDKEGSKECTACPSGFTTDGKTGLTKCGECGAKFGCFPSPCMQHRSCDY